MRTMMRWLPAAALAVLTTLPASAQPFGYRDDGPPPFRRGPGWNGPPRGPWDRWHRHRRWRDEGFDRRGGREEGRRDGSDRFGNDDGGRGRDRFDARRNAGDDEPRRGGPGRNGPRPFGNDDD